MRKFALIAGGAIAAACALAPTAQANTYADDYLEEVGLSIEFSAPLPAARLLQIGNQVCIDYASGYAKGWTPRQIAHNAYLNVKKGTGWTSGWDNAGVETSAIHNLCPQYQFILTADIHGDY